MNLANLQGIAKIGVLTFCGSFLGGLALQTVPVTLEDWKRIVLPALATAIAAEIIWARGQIAALLKAAVAGDPPTPITTTTTTATAVVTKTASIPPATIDKSGERGYVHVRLIAFSAAVALAVVAAITYNPKERVPTASVEILEGCNGPVSPNVVQNVLNDEQMACVVDELTTAVLPTGPVEQVAAAIQQLCQDKIPTGLTQLVVNFINALSARAGDAGLTHYLKAGHK